MSRPILLHLRTLVNGVEMQSAPTSNLIHDVPALIACGSEVARPEPGDLIVTGTPGAVGDARTPPVFLVPGDVVEVEFSSIGTSRHRVVGEAVRVVPLVDADHGGAALPCGHRQRPTHPAVRWGSPGRRHPAVCSHVDPPRAARGPGRLGLQCLVGWET